MRGSTIFDRRVCLKGVGAALALPLLDAMVGAETGEKRAYKPPVRLGFMYMPHGVIMDQFWPADADAFRDQHFDLGGSDRRLNVILFPLFASVAGAIPANTPND